MRAPWPEPDPAALEQDEIELVVQVNGKLRGSIRVPKARRPQRDRGTRAVQPNVQKFVAGQNVKKVVVVPGPPREPGGLMRTPLSSQLL